MIKSIVNYYENDDIIEPVFITDDGDFLPLLEFFEQKNVDIMLIGTQQGYGGISSKLVTKNYQTGEIRDIIYLDKIADIFI